MMHWGIKKPIARESKFPASSWIWNKNWDIQKCGFQCSILKHVCFLTPEI
jgi:hypothetical protein